MQKQTKQSKVSIRRILCVSILIVGISTFSSMRVNATIVSYDPPSYSSLTPHDPISITSDSGFAVFPGSGTAENPYLIEGYNITTTDSSGIYIADTTKYFIVRNCYVDAFLYGIYIYNVADDTATVTNNTCNNNAYFSIRFYASGSSTVANNTCNYNGYSGIFLSSSGSSTVANNICNNNDDYGIYLLFSDNSTITNNTCSNNNNLDGIYLEDSGSSIVTNNTCSNNYLEGIYLAGSHSSTVTNNTCSNNYRGIRLDSSDSSTVANNTCSNNGDGGIFLAGSDSLTVTNNTCSNNSFYGIVLYSSGSSTIINNTCNNNDWEGIKLYISGNSNVANNTCNYNGWGIDLSGSGSSTVANNTCNYNGFWGIDLSGSGSSTVANNTCYNNDWKGIELYSSAFCVVIYNLLQSNEEHGVYLESGSDNNLIHHNTFVDNNLGGTSQAYDDGTNNTWYDSATLEGNYWSDWDGTGFCSIDGYAGSIDLYPLDEPTVYLGPPVITDIIHSPSTPTELDTISINATVTSPYGVQSVTLHYRVNDGTWIEVSMTLSSGDFYSVTIGSFAVSDTIEYYVSAIDNSVNHNEAINDNSGLYYSFTISEFVPEFQMFSLLLPAITFLFLVFGLVVLQRRKK